MSEIASAQLILVTTPDVSGWTISRTFGMVTSEEAVAAGPIGDLSNSLHAIVGGKLPAAAEVISVAKDHVLRSASPHFSYPFVARHREDSSPRGAARIFRRAV